MIDAGIELMNKRRALLCIAKLVPRNDSAKLAFSAVYDSLDEQDLRRKLMIVGDSPVETVLRIGKHLDREKSSPDDANLINVIWIGHYLISTDDALTPKFPALGWRIGRSPDVDLQLTLEASDHVSNIHARFFFKENGVFQLESSNKNRNVIHQRPGLL